MDYSALFLKSTDSLSIEENKIKIEQIASLAKNFALQESLDTSIRISVVEALTLLGERKFEEAYAALMGSNRVMELKDLFIGSAKELEEQSAKATVTPRSNSVKY